MDSEQLEGKVQPHIKEAINPRPQLPHMPQSLACTQTHIYTQPSQSPTRIEQTVVMPQIQRIPQCIGGIF